MSDTGFKVLSMKINYLAPFKHKHKYQSLCPWKLATLHSFVAWDSSHDIFHKNKLPYICSMYDTGFKVLSMKINYLAPFKHKHKHQKLPMKISYLAFLHSISLTISMTFLFSKTWFYLYVYSDNRGNDYCSRTSQTSPKLDNIIILKF